MSINTDILDLVLPLESGYNLPINILSTLENVLCERNNDLTLFQWIDIASTISGLPDNLLRNIFELCEAFFHRKGQMRSSFLVFALFLQNVSSNRKRRLGEKKKRTEEESLKEFFLLNYSYLSKLFSQKVRLYEVLGIVIHGFQPDFDLSNLSPDPHGVTSCIKNGKSLSWRLGNPMTSKLARLATTAHQAADPRGRKMIVLSQLVKQTVIKNSSTVRGSCVLVHRAKQSQIILPTNLRSVNIVKARGSHILTGPVRRTVRVTGARNVTIVCVARRVIVQECVDCTFYIFTPNPPLLSSSCHNITFGPYNCNYVALPEDLKHARLDKKLMNYWKSPEVVSSNPGMLFPLPLQRSNILHVREFDKVCFPVNIEVSHCHPMVPVSYSDASKEKTERVQKWDEQVKEAELSFYQDEVLKSLIEKDFSKFIQQHYDVVSSNLNNLLT